MKPFPDIIAEIKAKCSYNELKRQTGCLGDHARHSFRRAFEHWKKKWEEDNAS